jgi:molybdate transport system ATP-binding protein
MTLELEIRHSFPAFELDASFEVPKGVTVLFGRSGSGKTTIANAVAGLFKPQGGRIVLDGQVLMDTARGKFLPPHKRRLGYIFQEGRLFPHMTVRQNLAYGGRFAPRQEAVENMERLIDLLGIGHLMDRRPALLSGGEKQRVAVGRAILASPRIVIADEPLAALDEQRKGEILPLFERLRDELAVPILYVTHSPAEVARLATTVVAMDQGRAVRVGPPEEVLSDMQVMPLGVRAAGSMIVARVAAHHEDGISELDANGVALFLPRLYKTPGEQIRVRIPAQDVLLMRGRPERISALNVIAGTVVEIREGDGPGAMVSLKTDAGLLLARVTKRSVAALELAAGIKCLAVVKTVAIAPEDVGH